MTDATPVIGHSVPKGVARLLSAARDLPSQVEASGELAEKGTGGDPHGQLFSRYLADLQWAVALAIPWWNAMVQRRIANGESAEEALRANYVLRPAGPASRPEVVWVVRTFWLECVRVNERVGTNRRVPPEVFLLKWLQRPEHDHLVAVLSGMPYWPIGLDENGSFC